MLQSSASAPWPVWPKPVRLKDQFDSAPLALAPWPSLKVGAFPGIPERPGTFGQGVPRPAPFEPSPEATATVAREFHREGSLIRPSPGLRREVDGGLRGIGDDTYIEFAVDLPSSFPILVVTMADCSYQVFGNQLSRN